MMCNILLLVPHFYFSAPTDYFIIQMYYGLGDVKNLSDYRFTGFVDFCAADYISKLELSHMAKGLKLHVEGCSS